MNKTVGELLSELMDLHIQKNHAVVAWKRDEIEPKIRAKITEIDAALDDRYNQSTFNK